MSDFEHGESAREELLSYDELAELAGQLLLASGPNHKAQIVAQKYAAQELKDAAEKGKGTEKSVHRWWLVERAKQLEEKEKP